MYRPIEVSKSTHFKSNILFRYNKNSLNGSQSYTHIDLCGVYVELISNIRFCCYQASRLETTSLFNLLFVSIHYTCCIAKSIYMPKTNPLPYNLENLLVYFVHEIYSHCLHIPSTPIDSLKC